MGAVAVDLTLSWWPRAALAAALVTDGVGAELRRALAGAIRCVALGRLGDTVCATIDLATAGGWAVDVTRTLRLGLTDARAAVLGEACFALWTPWLGAAKSLPR